MIYSSDEFRTEFARPMSSFAQTTHRAEAPQESFRGRPKLGLIGVSPLLKECLLREFSDRGYFETVAFSDVNDHTLQKSVASYHLLMFFAQGMHPSRAVAVAKTLLGELGTCPPFAVLADSEDIDEVLAAFSLGVCAYIPTSVSFDVMTEAIKLGIAGGTYYPTCVFSVCALGRESKQDSMYALTPREIAVLDAVRQGRPNKVIAQELGISESTIKVHVHRIMKKLKVRNRTQAAMCARN
ncbi:MAG: response regulator transcription factor [Methylovirgula sp.]|uniref:response regulator transcription factor n=1 Tax=Methylovirgula sp. TaxID=1978224 RepID=UPI0030765993